MIRTILLVALTVTLLTCASPRHALADESEAQLAVLVTGASSGIGRNAAERLAAAPWGRGRVGRGRSGGADRLPDIVALTAA